MQLHRSELRPGPLVTLSAALMFFYGFLLGGMQLVIGDVAALYGAGQSGIGFLVSAQHLTSASMPVLLGAAADKIGKKPVLTLASALFGLGCLTAGLSGSLWVYVAGALLIGLGYSVCESLSSAVLTDLDREKGMTYINLAQCLLSVGAIISPMLLRLAMNRWGADWRLVYLICAGAFLILAVPLALVRFPQPSAQTEQSAKGAGILRSWLFLAPFFAILLYVGLENGFGYFIGSLFGVKLHEARLGAFAISAYWTGMALSRFLCGLRTYTPRPMLLGCFGLSAALFVLLALSHWGWLSVCASFLVGAAFGPVFSTLMGTAAARFPRQSATAAGLMSTGCGISGILYPALMGLMSEHFSLTAAFLTLAATALAGFLLSAKK